MAFHVAKINKAKFGSSIRGDKLLMSVSNEQIIRGVKVEVLRTIPFWRCFLDLKKRFNRTPVVESIETVVQRREPCVEFVGVDVVWAVTTAVIRVQTACCSNSRKRYREASKSTSSISSSKKSSHSLVGLVKSWRGVPSEAFTFTLGTMHFVHVDIRNGGERSFHIQSVYLYEKPHILQCVAGVMVNFALLLHTGVKIMNEVRKSKKSLLQVYRNIMGESEKKSLPKDDVFSDRFSSCHDHSEITNKPTDLFPSYTSRVLVLGMGGNSMAIAMRHVLGPSASIEVVEIEPAVVQVCQNAGTLLEDDRNHRVYVEDAQKFLRGKLVQCVANEDLYDFIFMDLFEPLEAQMESGESMVHQCYRLLSEGGMLVINEHILPDPKHLVIFTKIFGDGLVHAVNLHGWKESVVIGFKNTSTVAKELENRWVGTEVSLACSVQMARVVQSLYERWFPGFFPDISVWLKSMRTFNKIPHRCRIWES